MEQKGITSTCLLPMLFHKWTGTLFVLEIIFCYFFSSCAFQNTFQIFLLGRKLGEQPAWVDMARISQEDTLPIIPNNNTLHQNANAKIDNTVQYCNTINNVLLRARRVERKKRTGMETTKVCCTFENLEEKRAETGHSISKLGTKRTTCRMEVWGI